MSITAIRAKATEAFAAACDVETAAHLIANISTGDPVLEALAKELANTAVVIEMIAHNMVDEALGGYDPSRCDS